MVTSDPAEDPCKLLVARMAIQAKRGNREAVMDLLKQAEDLARLVHTHKQCGEDAVMCELTRTFEREELILIGPGEEKRARNHKFPVAELPFRREFSLAHRERVLSLLESEHGIVYVSQLTTYTPDELVKGRQLGSYALDELRFALHAIGKRLRRDKWRPTNENRP